jgi:hypothetical protein
MVKRHDNIGAHERARHLDDVTTATKDGIAPQIFPESANAQ